MNKVDELLWQMWLDEHGEEDFDEHKTKIKQAIQALIAKECNKAKMEQLTYMEQFAQKQDIDWDYIANMIGQLELSNKEDK